MPTTEQLQSAERNLSRQLSKVRAAERQILDQLKKLRSAIRQQSDDADVGESSIGDLRFLLGEIGIGGLLGGSDDSDVDLFA